MPPCYARGPPEARGRVVQLGGRVVRFRLGFFFAAGEGDGEGDGLGDAAIPGAGDGAVGPG